MATTDNDDIINPFIKMSIIDHDNTVNDTKKNKKKELYKMVS